MYGMLLRQLGAGVVGGLVDWRTRLRYRDATIGHRIGEVEGRDDPTPGLRRTPGVVPLIRRTRVGGAEPRCGTRASESHLEDADSCSAGGLGTEGHGVGAHVGGGAPPGLGCAG